MGPKGRDGVNVILRFLRISNFFRVSASLLLSVMKIIVRPPSRITGNLSFIDPDVSFDSGTLT
jgi:hypothetical protein